MNAAIAGTRLHNQRISGASCRGPADVVRWFGAVQAQDYPAARWALGLRMRDGATDEAINRAFDAGRILRTHVMRPTWHFVTPPDIHWMLELTAARVQQRLSYANRYYGLDAETRRRATRVFEEALNGNRHLTRAELGDHLAHAGINAKGIHLALLTVHAELEGIICSGPRRGQHMTYALLAERVPLAHRLSRDEAIASLTRRYFRSHGPATIRDVVWWSGLTTTDARRGVDMCRCQQEVVDGLTYWRMGRAPVRRLPAMAASLLPIWDEYLVGYRDVAAVPRQPGSGRMLTQAVVIAGQVAGTWKAIRSLDRVAVTIQQARRLTTSERQRLARAVERYSGFLQARTSLTIR